MSRSATANWASTFAGVGRRGRARRLRVQRLHASEQAHLPEPGPGILVARVLGEGALVGRDGPLVVAGLDRVVRFGVQRRQRRLGVVDLGRRRVGAVDGHRARHTVLGCDLQQLGEDLAHLLLGHRAGEQRHGLAADEGDDHRDRLGAESLRELRVGIDIHLGEHQAAAEFEDDLLEDRAELLARPAPFGPQVDDDRNGARKLEHLTERGVRDIQDERRDGCRGGAARGRGGAGSRRLRPIAEC